MVRIWRLAALALACCLLIGGVAPARAAPFETSGSTSTSVSTEGATTAPVVIATYNIRHGLSDAVAVSDIQSLADSGVGVIALQEMGSPDRQNAVRNQLLDCSSCEFNAFMPDGAGRREIPILYRSLNYDLLSKGSQKVSDATYVGPSGAGPSTIAAKYLNYVQLRHKVTGQEMYIINSHTVASVQAPDGGANYERPERLQLYRQHMNGLKAMITEFKATGAAVFTTGDFNVNYRRDSVLRDKVFPYYNMSQVGVFASYKFLGMPEYGTHLSKSGTNDLRLIDYVSSLGHAAVEPKVQSVLTGYNSDHRPVRVRYAVTRAPDTAAPVLSSFDFTPKAVDVSGGAKNVVVTARVTDATGAMAPTLRLTSGSTTQTAGFGVMSRLSGTATDGVYRRTVSIPWTASAGSWTVSIDPLEDTLGNIDNVLHRHPDKLMVANATVPGAPTEVHAEAGERSAEVSWVPAPDNGAAVTEYTVSASPGTAQITAAGEAASGTLTGLTVGTSYTFTVRASNRMGNGPASASSNLVAAFAVPPETVITAGPVNRSFVTSPKQEIAFSANDPNASFECSLDGFEHSCGASPVNVSFLARTTHVFTVAARDGDGDVDASPATRVWTVPQNNTALTHSSGWSQLSRSGCYLGTLSQTTQRDAALSVRMAGIRKLALLATKGPGYGTVNVYLGSTLLKQVDLASSVLAKRQLVPIASFSTGRTGNVRIVVASSDKTVRVEGLGLATG